MARVLPGRTAGRKARLVLAVSSCAHLSNGHLDAHRENLLCDRLSHDECLEILLTERFKPRLLARARKGRW